MVFTLPLGRLARSGKISQEAEQFSGSVGRQGGGCCRGKRSSGVFPGDPVGS